MEVAESYRESLLSLISFPLLSSLIFIIVR